MQKMKKNKYTSQLFISLSVPFLCMPLSSFALLCPNNFNFIDFGYAVSQVTQQCGNPDKAETTEIKNEPEEWDYYIQQPANLNTNYQPAATLKTTVTFDDKGNSINMNVNGIGVGSSSICGKGIQLGDNKEAIKAACGQPAYINKLTSTSQTDVQPKKITTLTYFGSPNVVFKFEDDKLISRD